MSDELLRYDFDDYGVCYRTPTGPFVSYDNSYAPLEAENARLKQSLRLQIEQNALAQVGFKMYQDNVDSGGLHKDRKDAIARLEAENARLKAEIERLTKAADAMAARLMYHGYPQTVQAWNEAKGVQS
jgi:hypothetical protein